MVRLTQRFIALLGLSIGFQAQSQSLPAPGQTIEAVNPRDGAVVCFVPSGNVTLGGYLPAPASTWNYLREGRVTVPGFWIYKYEVTRRQFTRFIKENGRPWQDPSLVSEADDSPITLVTWEESKAYCEWAGGSLPSEAQWEKSARGIDNRRYPWGNRFDSSLVACSSSPDLNRIIIRHDPPGAWGLTHSTVVCPVAVGTYSRGASPYGVFHMVGNVEEWCLDAYDPTFSPKDEELVCRLSPTTLTGQHVLRGGSFGSLCDEVHLNSIVRSSGDKASSVRGFRCALREGSIVRE